MEVSIAVIKEVEGFSNLYNFIFNNTYFSDFIIGILFAFSVCILVAIFYLHCKASKNKKKN